MKLCQHHAFLLTGQNFTKLGKCITGILFQVSLLKSVEEEVKKKRGASGEGGPDAKKPMSK